MFGLVQPCGHVLDTELRKQWRSHLCGLCLGLRDDHGQLARITTNTDAVMVSVLTSAQRTSPTATRTAGPCPLRGMRNAEVVESDQPGIALATAASLALAAAKADDVVAEQRAGLAAPSPGRVRAAKYTGRLLHRRARKVTALDVDAVLTPLAGQSALECATTDLNSLLEPTARACAAVFAASADRAGAPDNRVPLADIGADFGRLAHLLDAIDDRDADRVACDFNPLAATGTTDRAAVARAEMLADRIAERYRDLVLYDDRLLRVLLVDGVIGAVARRRRLVAARAVGVGASPAHLSHASFPPPPPFKPNRRWYERVLPFAGVTCCGPACVGDHWNHCTDEYVPRMSGGCDDCGDCCDCGGCCDCEDCCDCGDCCDCCDCGS